MNTEGNVFTLKYNVDINVPMVNVIRGNYSFGLNKAEPMLLGWTQISNYLGYSVVITRQLKNSAKRLVHLLINGGYVFYKFIRPKSLSRLVRIACSFKSLLDLFLSKINGTPPPEIPNNLIQTQANICSYLRIDYTTFKNEWKSRMEDDGLIFTFNGKLCAFESQLKAALVKYYYGRNHNHKVYAYG
jgi:hypothetical protein